MNVLEHYKEIDGDRKIADFRVKMQLPYDAKVHYAEIRAREFVDECNKRDLNYHVSVGGLDSITLFLFLKHIGIYAPAISVSSLEDKSIQAVHKLLGVECLKCFENIATHINKVSDTFGLESFGASGSASNHKLGTAVEGFECFGSESFIFIVA